MLYPKYMGSLPARRAQIRLEFLEASGAGETAVRGAAPWTMGGGAAISAVVAYWGIAGAVVDEGKDVNALVLEALTVLAAQRGRPDWAQREQARQVVMAMAAREALALYGGDGIAVQGDPLEPLEGESREEYWERARAFAQGVEAELNAAGPERDESR